MKKLFVFGLIASFFITEEAFSQDIPQSQVPAVVLDNFQKAFSGARDIEWEMDGYRYKVEFETGMRKLDHDAWYDASGQLLKHQEEISKNDLPRQITTAIKREFKGYRVEDVDKITEGQQVTYIMEVKSRTEEWKLKVDPEGNILSKVAD